MRGVVLCALLTGCAAIPQVVLPALPTDVGVEEGLRHTLLMTEGCTAVDIGRGRVLTAKHCVKDLELGVTTSVGVLIYKSAGSDFAVLDNTDIVLHTLAAMRAPILGEHLYAIGWPQQLATETQELTVTDGIYAGPLDSEGNLRITAPIYYGNSGGGVWAEDGSLVGLSVNGYLTMPGMNYMVNASVIASEIP